jgi:hypothetical protein
MKMASFASIRPTTVRMIPPTGRPHHSSVVVTEPQRASAAAPTTVVQPDCSLRSATPPGSSQPVAGGTFVLTPVVAAGNLP